jgi:Aspartyl/Asparaginyl beta-hydroxylase
MLDIPGHPEINKATLVGGCVRLPLTVDGERLQQEVDGLPNSVWGTRGGRVGHVRLAEAVFLRGYAPAEGEKPVDDRPALQDLPYVREIIGTVIPAPPLRCLLARLPAGAVVGMHVDSAPYFSKTLRLHIPVTTHETAWMLAGGLAYHMRLGEIWVLNNSGMHGVWNADDALSRTHLICDFLPTAELLALLARGDRGLGRADASIEGHIRKVTERQL